MSKVIAAIPSSCAVLLTYTANLVTDGTVRFVYQYEDQKTVLHFKVRGLIGIEMVHVIYRVTGKNAPMKKPPQG